MDRTTQAVANEAAQRTRMRGGRTLLSSIVRDAGGLIEPEPGAFTGRPLEREHRSTATAVIRDIEVRRRRSESAHPTRVV